MCNGDDVVVWSSCDGVSGVCGSGCCGVDEWEMSWGKEW